MMIRRTFLASLFVVLWLGSSSIVLAQFNTATLSGRITDPQGKVVPTAEVQLVNIDTNVGTTTQTNGDGIYVLSGIQPGRYRLTVRKDGFHEILKPEFTLHTQDDLEQNFSLEVGSVAETVTVSGGISEAETTNPAVSMTVTREFVENMPLNGRSFQDLIQLAPGTVSNQNGYYSIDGQRTDGNNYTVDGVSANLGGLINQSGGNIGSGLSGASPSQTVLGTTQSLVSIDALQEFKIQTSGYAAEYGRNPGGQVSFTTRSGTNDIHGTLFEYLRNTAFDAKSYQEDYFDQPKSAEHQNDFGGTIGGPVVIPKLYDGKDKTFFFFSYEGLRLLLPNFESEYVPTQAFRQLASPSVQPFLNASPLPNPNSQGNNDGCTVPNPTTGLPTACDALFTYGYSYPNNLNSINVRLDQSLGKSMHGFIRYADTSSSSRPGAELLAPVSINANGWTAGLTASITSTLLNDLRFNYSRDGEGGIYSQRPVGGSVPLPRNLLIPTEYDNQYAEGYANISVPGSSLNVSPQYLGSGSVLHQYQFVDSVTWTRGSHSIKFGGDWRRLSSHFAIGSYSSTVVFDSLANIQQGYATSVQVSAIAPGQPVFDGLSLYAEDHWKISPKLSVDYGLRWEFNPSPGPSNGHYPATLTSRNLAMATLAPAGTPPYKTSYDHLAPRIGFAWSAIASQRYALTVRGGFGIFFDTGQQSIGNAYAAAYPFQASGPTLNQVPLPLSSSVLAPPSLNVPLIPPYPHLNELTSPSLTLPYTEQWNLSIDEAISTRNTLTVSYVGNEGKKLLFTGYYTSAPGNPINPDFTSLNFTYNGSSSNYNALQVQDRGRIANGLDLVASFTWAHALDNASSNYGGLYPTPFYGNSDNDLRRVLNLALNYQSPSAGSSQWERAFTHGWVIANRFSTQSGYPFDVYQDQYVPLPDGGQQNYLPDLVPGVPIYLHGSAADVNGQPVPGNWRLNPAAFAMVPTDPTTGLPVRQGTLGRNFVRGPGFYALNTAVQRSFPIYERLHLIFRVEAFNVLNHPNLDFPDTTLSDSTFGQIVPGYGGGPRTIGVSNQLYAMGAPRSLQLSLKLQF